MTRARLPCSLHFPDQSLRTKVSIVQHIFFSRSHEFTNIMYLVSKTKARLVAIHDTIISVRSTTPEPPLLPAGHTMSKLNTANLDSTMRGTRRSLPGSRFPNQVRRSNSAVTRNGEAHPSAFVPSHTPLGLQCTAAGPAP